MLATYMRRMRKNNLDISIAGSSCRPQQRFCVKSRVRVFDYPSCETYAKHTQAQ